MSDTGSTIDKNVGEIKSIEGERGDEAMSVDGTTIITGDGDSDSEEEVESTDVAGQEVVSTDVAGQESQGSLKMEDLNVSKEGSQVDLAQDTTTNIEGEGEGEDKSVSSEDLASGEGEAGKYGPEDQIKSAAFNG